MRKYYAMILALVFILTAANVAVLDNSKATGYNIRSSSGDLLEMVFRVGRIGYQDIETERGMFTKLSIENGYYTYDEGAPELPTFHELIAMPYGSEPQVEILSYKTQVYKLSELGINHPVFPAQPSYSKSSKPEERLFVYNENAYNISKHTGKPSASIHKSGTMRGIGIGRIEILPFSYNAEEGSIEVYSDIVVRVTYIGADPQWKEIAEEEYSPVFEYSVGTLVNSDKFRTESKEGLLNFPVTYLIVANDNLNGNVDLDRFIAWKREKGYDVITNYVAASTPIATIDSWIENQYGALDPKPSFVLVVGDHDGTYGVLSEVNPPLGSTGSVTRSDLLYGVIGATGASNRIPSMYVGRFSVRSTDELKAQVDKTIWYEKEQFDSVLNPGQDFTYLTRAMGTAGSDASYQASHGNPHISYQMSYFFNDIYTNPLTSSTNGMTGIPYYNGASGPATNIVNNVSTGVAWYNYTAHGYNNEFSNPQFSIANINSLSNQGKYPLVVGNCCLTGSFGDTECFGEAWLNVADKGGIGFIGASMSTYWNEDLSFGIGSGGTGSVNSGYTDPLSPPPFTPNDKGSVDAMMMSNHPTQGNVKHTALLAVETYGGTYVSSYWSSYHLFGDPSLMLVMGPPQTLTASSDPIIPGSTSYTVTTEPYAYVAISKDGVLHGAAEANASGVANLTITPFSPGDIGDIVVTARFSKPYFGQATCTGDIGGTFSVDQTSLSYGSIDAGSTSVKTFTITNSHSTQYLTGDITTPTGYSVALALKEITKDIKNTMNYAVSPNSTKTFNVTFEPTAGQVYSGNVVVTSSDTGHSTQNIAVTGTGIVPDINLDPVSLTASTAPDATDIQTFNIKNDDIGQLDYSMTINYTSGKEIKASGGPDTFGYKWKDSDEAGGPVYNWVDITGSGTIIGFTSYDQNEPNIPIGFDFNFYGNTYNTVNVCTNGWISFTSTSTAYTNTTIIAPAEPNNLLAAFWDDLNPGTTGGGDVYYYSDTANNRFIVQWDAVYDYGATTPNTFQIILYTNGKIVYQYADMQGDLVGSTVGIENADGTDGSLVTFNTAYLKNNLAIEFMATPEWLSLNPTSGSINGIGSNMITATCDATGLEVGVYTADIYIASNDPLEPTKTLPVTFNVAYGATGGTFGLNNSSLSYGNVGVGSNIVKTFEITNSHATEYLMGDITTIEGYTVAASAKGEAKNTLGYTVSPSTSKIFNLTFAPLAEQAYNGNITITSTDGAHATEYIAVTGTGTAPTFGIPFSQDFNASTSLPTAWTIVDHQGNGQVWTFGTHGSGLSGADGNYAYLNSDGYGSGNTQNADLVTPKIDMSNASDITLSFSHYYRHYSSGSTSATLSYSIDGGANWVQIQQWVADTSNPASFNQAVPALNGQSNVKLKWNFTGSWGYYWDIDDILITGTITSLGVPPNVVTSILGANLVIDWDIVANATSYDVYSSDDPYSGFTLVTNVGTNQYTVAYTASKKFYYIVAKN